MHVAHDVGVVDQRPRAPQRLVAPALGVGQPAPELGGDATVEDHAALGLQQLLDAAIRRRRLAPSGQPRPVLQHAHVGHSRSAAARRRLPGGRDAPVRRGGKGVGRQRRDARQPQVLRGRLGPVGDVHLAQDVLDVELDRALGHDQRAGDLGVGLALDEVLEDVELARGQQVVQRRARGGRPPGLLGVGELAVAGEVDGSVGELGAAPVGPAGDAPQLLALDAQAPAQDRALVDLAEALAEAPQAVALDGAQRGAAVGAVAVQEADRRGPPSARARRRRRSSA